MMWGDLHFLRPLWLLALLPVSWIVARILQSPQRSSSWRSAVDPHLLGHLMLEGDRGASRWPTAALVVGWVATCLALAGPTWERQPSPSAQTVEPLVIALDMSASMEAGDVTPSRLARARHKIQDILERQAGGSVALVLFGEEPFVAVPLTDDGRVIAEMLPLLDGDLIPDLSSRPDRAIDQARLLLGQAGAAGGHILLLGDSAGADSGATLAAAAQAASAGRRVSVLGVGTEEGAPVPDGRGRFLRSPTGEVVNARLDPSGLQSIAAAGRGRMALLEAGDGDLRRLLEAGRGRFSGSDGVGGQGLESSAAGFDRWKDVGALLAWVPLLLSPLAFRRGLLATWILGWMLLGPTSANAGLWRDLWQTPDQQGARALARGDAAVAAGLFESPRWRAAAHYESGDFAAAEAAFERLPGLSDRYNRGNALARSGRLEEALAAYDGVLAEDPDHRDARFNRDLVERLLEQSRSDGGDSRDGEQSAGERSQDGEQSVGERSQRGEQDPGNDPDRGEEQAGSTDRDEPQREEAAQNSGQREQENAGGDERRRARAEDPFSSEDFQQEERGERHGAEGDPSDGETHRGRPHEEFADAAEQDHFEDEVDRALAERPLDEMAAAPLDEMAEARGPQPLSEEEQAREQMLRRVPDDPAGLLRARIHRAYAQRRYAERAGPGMRPEGNDPWR